MNPFTPPSPAARLRALKRALWEEDRAEEGLSRTLRRQSPRARLGELREADAALNAARAGRMEAERALWGCAAGHGLD